MLGKPSRCRFRSYFLLGLNGAQVGDFGFERSQFGPLRRNLLLNLRSQIYDVAAGHISTRSRLFENQYADWLLPGSLPAWARIRRRDFPAYGSPFLGEC